MARSELFFVFGKGHLGSLSGLELNGLLLRLINNTLLRSKKGCLNEMEVGISTKNKSDL